MILVEIELYKHQEDAVERMKNKCVLVGGVGSGKSRTALAYYFSKVCGGTLKPFRPPTRLKDLYIITTAMKRNSGEWHMECSNFLLSIDRKNSIRNTQVVIDSWNNIKKYVNVTNAFFIFDEQRVVGYGTWTKSFLKITKSNEWILLSATPGDTWSDYIPVFIANGFYKNKTDFCNKHAIYSRFSKYPKIERYVGERYLMHLRDSILVDMPCERNTVQHHHYVIVDYNKELYRSTMKTRWNPYKNEPIQDAGGLCLVLRQIVNTDSRRIEKTKELILERRKVIIFYNFNTELDLLKAMLEESSIPFSEWNGHCHEALPTGDLWAYLVQYSAGAEGWNCITTDTIIFYSQNYSYRITTQAAGRIDRINTPFTDLEYYYLSSAAPIDMAIRRALNNKRDFNEKKFIGG